MPAPFVARSVRLSLALACVVLAGCNTAPPRALRLVPEFLQYRQMQNRRFTGAAASEIVAACAGALQDLGFVLDESNSNLGVITASKGYPANKPLTPKDAVLAAVIVVGVVAVIAANPGLLAGGLLPGGGSSTPPPQPEQIRVTLVITPSADGSGGSFLVRATFQKELATTSGSGPRVVSGEPLNTPELYDEFFRKLAQGLQREPQTT